MEQQWIVMLKTFKEHKKGEKYLVDTAYANELLEAELAEKSADPTGDIYTKLEKSMEARDAQLVEKISTALNGTVKAFLPAQAKEEETKSFDEFIRCVGKTSNKFKDQSEKIKAFNILETKYKANYNQGTNAQGLYTVPETWSKELFKVDGFQPAVFNRLKPIQMAKVHHIPTVDQTVTPSAGSSAYYGGVAVSIVSESAPPSANTLKAFKQTTLTAKKVMAMTQSSTEVLSNSSVDLGADIRSTFGEAVVKHCDNRIFNGAGGSSDFTGIINHAACISVPRQTANSITLLDAANMVSRLNPAGYDEAVWVCNAIGYAKLIMMTDAEGNAVWLPNGSAGGRPQLSLLGIPVVLSDALPTVGSSGDLVLFTPSAYAFGLNRDITVDVSEHFAFTSDLITYRVTTCLDLVPNITAPIKLMNGTDTVSPFVQLSATVAS